MNNLEKEYLRAFDNKVKCVNKKCSKTRKNRQKEFVRITREIKKKCRKIKNSTKYFQCSQTVDKSNMRILSDKNINCGKKKCKKEDKAIKKIQLKMDALSPHLP